MNNNAKTMLSVLGPHPQSARELMRTTGFTDKEVRTAIDTLRAQEYCVWHDRNHGGFWIDTPVARGVPVGSDRWKRLAT